MAENRPPLEAWIAESLRITAFPGADSVVTPETWWKDLLGEESTTKTIQRAQFLRQEQGEWQGSDLSLVVRPGRIDWTLSAKMPQDGPPPGIPAVGQFVEIVPRFVDLILGWTPASPPIDRLAFGVVAFVPVSDHAQGYAVLDALLPSVQVDPSATDFKYQINRPRPSRLGIEELRINRLVLWSVMRMELVAITGGPRLHRSPGQFACRAEIDINTSPDFARTLPQERVPDLLREFLDLSSEIVSEGDRP